MSGTFAKFQPIYAEHGVATFPVTTQKTPATRGYLRTGVNGSRALASKFPDAPGLGFATDRRSKVTVLDIDTSDERVLAEALDRHGQTPAIVRTGSGKFHAYYRHNGERRRIRPWPDRPIDLLGSGGMVVAPPSQVITGGYLFLQGSLDDLNRLPVLRGIDFPSAPVEPNTGKLVGLGTGPRDGTRNASLYRHLMRNASSCITFDDLMDLGRAFNQTCQPPDDESTVVTTAESVWKMTLEDRNWFGRGAIVPVKHDDIDGLMLADPEAFILDTYLRRHHWGREFTLANATSKILGWRRQKFSAVRQRLVNYGRMRIVQPETRHTPMKVALSGVRVSKSGQ